MAAVVVAAAEFISTAIFTVGASIATATGIGGFAWAGAALGDAVVDAAAALTFSAGIGAGIQSWILAGSILDLATSKPKLSQGNGSPQQFKADSNAPVPILIGQTGSGGNIIYQTTSGGSNKHGASGNQYLTSCVVLSGLGPIDSFQQFKANQTVLTFDTGGRQGANNGYIPALYLPGRNNPYPTPYYNNGNNLGGANSQYNGKMWMNNSLGGTSGAPFQPAAFDTNAALTEWDNSKSLAGFAASFWTCVYDTGAYAGGLPKPLWTVKGIKVYDPRRDATYPGGAGPQRWSDRSTWSWSANPYIHALNYALGFWLPDPSLAGNYLLFAGIGAPWSGVDVAAFVAGANIADANAWQVNGQWTTADDKFSVLTLLLQAGGGQPVDNGGIISCAVSTPQTSIGVIGIDDLADGSVSVDTTASVRSRINRVFPKYREPNADYEFVQPTSPVTVQAYVNLDGRVRSKELNYEFVTSVNQACQLAAYDLVNTREGVVATIPCKLRWAQNRPGDCLTVNLPDANLSFVKMRIEKRIVDWRSGIVTLTLRSETDSKHGFALGLTGTAPATATITGADPSLVTAPNVGQWAAAAATLTDASSGEQVNVIRVTGSASDNVFAAQIVIRYRPVGASTWSTRVYDATTVQADIQVGAGVYQVAVNYVTALGASDLTKYLDLGQVTVSPMNAALIGGLNGGQVNNALVPVGANAATNSDWANGNTSGWFQWPANNQPGAVFVSGINLTSGGVSWFGARNVTYCGLTSTSGALTQGAYFFGWCQRGFNGGLSDLQRYGLAVTAGDRILFGGLVAGHRCSTVNYRVRCFNASGSLVFEFDALPSGFVTADLGGKTANGGDPSAFYQCAGYVDIPAGLGVAWAVIGTYAYVMSAPVTSAYIFTTQPYLQKGQPGQTVANPYAAGPADKLADKTGENIAPGITGQGALATQNSLTYGSGFLLGFGALAGANAANTAANQLYSPVYGYLTDPSIVTGVGISAGFTGQGALATKNSLGYGSPYLTGFGSLATLGSVDTGNINARAVTAVTAAFTTGPGIVYGGQTNVIQQIGYTATGQPIIINASSIIGGSGDGTSPPEVGLIRVQGGVSTYVYPSYSVGGLTVAFSIVDTPSAGVVYYQLVLAAKDNSYANWSRASLWSLELKR